MMNLITRILLPLCLLLPITTFGETMDDVKKREGLYYKKFTDVPFTGTVTGEEQGELVDGKKEGLWFVYYHDGQLEKKGTYKDGEKEDDWVYYSRDGSVLEYGED